MRGLLAPFKSFKFESDMIIDPVPEPAPEPDHAPTVTVAVAVSERGLNRKGVCDLLKIRPICSADRGRKTRHVVMAGAFLIWIDVFAVPERFLSQSAPM